MSQLHYVTCKRRRDFNKLNQHFFWSSKSCLKYFLFQISNSSFTACYLSNTCISTVSCHTCSIFLLQWVSTRSLHLNGKTDLKKIMHCQRNIVYHIEDLKKKSLPWQNRERTHQWVLLLPVDSMTFRITFRLVTFDLTCRERNRREKRALSLPTKRSPTLYESRRWTRITFANLRRKWIRVIHWPRFSSLTPMTTKLPKLILQERSKS